MPQLFSMLSLLLGTWGTLAAEPTENYIEHFDFKVQGNAIAVEYRLKPLPSVEHFYEVELRGDLDGRAVSTASSFGDIGRVETANDLKRIFWNCLLDEPRLVGNLSLRLEVRLFGKKKQMPVVDDPFEKNMVFVEGGTFQMGSTDGASDEQPVHSVRLNDFYISKYEVTQAEWRRVMGSDPPDLRFKGCDRCPVERVSWNDIQDFLKKINEQNPGKNYRLPTEAEWEYAARGGQKSQNFKFSGSNNLTEVGWFSENAGSKTHSVGKKKPNELGLYDLSGNVWEWCSDWYDSKYYEKFSSSTADNPAGGSGSSKVSRGGSWNDYYSDCRPANRDNNDSYKRHIVVGFRLARD